MLDQTWIDADVCFLQVRKAHLNDLENILPFLLLSVLYVATNPNPTVALWHFRVSNVEGSGEKSILGLSDILVAYLESSFMFMLYLAFRITDKTGI